MNCPIPQAVASTCLPEQQYHCRILNVPRQNIIIIPFNSSRNIMQKIFSRLLGSAHSFNSYWLSRLDCASNPQVGQYLATWSLHVRVREFTLLHLLVLGDPPLDIVDDRIKLLLLSGVTRHPGRQDGSGISEALFSQRPVAWIKIETWQSRLRSETHQPRNVRLPTGNASQPKPYNEQLVNKIR